MKKNIVIAFKSVLIALFIGTLGNVQAQNPLAGSRLNLTQQGSTPSNPASGYTTIFADNTGLVKTLLPNGTTKALIGLSNLSATAPLSFNSSTGDFSLAGLSSLGTANYLVGVNSGVTGWEYKQLIAGTNVTITHGTGSITIAASGGAGGATAINDLGDANAAGTVDNANNTQTWTWNSLGSGTGLALTSSSTAAASNTQKLFSSALSGTNATANQTTYAGFFSNTHAGSGGTNIGLYSTASGGATLNLSGYFESGKLAVGTLSGSMPSDENVNSIEITTTGSNKPVISLHRPAGSRYKFGVSTDNKLYLTNNNGDSALGSGSGLTLNSSGQLGILNTSPATPLDVTGVARATSMVVGTTTTAGTNSERTLEIYDGSNSVTLRLQRPGSSEYRIGVYTNNKLYITNNNGPTDLGASTKGFVIDSNGYATLGSATSASGQFNVVQGTLTSSLPSFAHTATWNGAGQTFNNFTSNITDTASASDSTLFRFQVGGTNKIYGRKDGFLFTDSGVIGSFTSFYGFTAFSHSNFAASQSTDGALYQDGGVGSTYVNCKSTGDLSFRYGGADRAKLENSGADWDFSLNNNYFKTKQLVQTVNAAGNSGTSLTINFNNGANQTITLTGNATFTFSNPVAGATYTLVLTQDATGSRTVTWPGSVVWSGASAPTLTTTANKVDIVELKYIGTTYYGRVYGLNY